MSVYNMWVLRVVQIRSKRPCGGATHVLSDVRSDEIQEGENGFFGYAID